MNNRYLFLFVFFFSISLCGVSQHKVIKVEKESAEYISEEGFFYTLPQNYLVIHTQITKTNKYKGPFGDFADDLLGLSAIKENQIIYSINNIEVKLGYEADLSELYYVVFPKKEKQATYYQFLKNGLLLNKTDIQGKEDLPAVQIRFPGPSNKEKEQFEMYENYSMYEKIDTIYETKLVDSIYVQIPKIQKQMLTKTTEEKANEALKEIKNIREAQWLLLTGEHEVNFSNLDFMLTSLKEKEQVYLSLFTGFSVSEEVEYMFYIPLPDKKDTLNIPLFCFTSEEGIIPSEEEDCDVYSLQLVNSHTTDAMASFLETEIQQRNNKKRIPTGFRYRIPEYYTINFYLNEVELKKCQKLPINQYGIINVLPNNVSEFEIDPLTGNVNNVILK